MTPPREDPRPREMYAYDGGLLALLVAPINAHFHNTRSSGVAERPRVQRDRAMLRVIE